MPLEFAIAGIGSRFLAIALDTVIQFGIGIILMIVAIVILVYTPVFPEKPLWVGAGMVAMIFLLNFGYFTAFEIMWNGQTPGKRQAGIRVVKDSGRPLTSAEFVGRNLLRIVDMLPGFYAVGILVALLNKQNKRLGDLLAGSIVVREASIADLKPNWQTDATAIMPGSPVLDASQLTREDLALIDTFLHRRSEMDDSLRVRMAQQILVRIQPRVSLDPASKLSMEGTLEALAIQRRSSGSV